MSSHDGHAGIVESALVGSADEFDHIVTADLAIGTKVDEDCVEEFGGREELLVTQEHPDVDDVKVSEGFEEVVGDVACCDDWTQADVSVQVVCHCLVLCEQGERDRRSLRVSHVKQLGVGGRRRDVLPHRRQVVLGHLFFFFFFFVSGGEEKKNQKVKGGEEDVLGPKRTARIPSGRG